VKARKTVKNAILSLVAVVLVAGYQYFQHESANQSGPHESSIAWRKIDIPAAWADGDWVTTGGTVTRVLADDNDGSRHQRFIIRLSNQQTLLVAHNIDLADRIPLRAGDSISLRGRYETNNRGGVIHWTHHDPSGRARGGWIEYNGKRYH
jgi:hypothetical protein